MKAMPLGLLIQTARNLPAASGWPALQTLLPCTAAHSLQHAHGLTTSGCPFRSPISISQPVRYQIVLVHLVLIQGASSRALSL